VILLVVQAVAVSLGALPVFWLVRKHLGSEKAATAFALAYLAYPATQWNALDPNLGFHPVSLALPLLLYALWWLDEERWMPFAIAAVLAAASNEQVPVWYGVTRKRPVFGASLFATGLALTVVDFLIVPHFSTSGTNPFAGRYTAVGGTAGGIVKTLLLHPLKAAEVIPTGHKWRTSHCFSSLYSGSAFERRSCSLLRSGRWRSISCRLRLTRRRSRVTTRRRPPPSSSGQRSSARRECGTRSGSLLWSYPPFL
jgi:hypothetical protein